VTAKNIFQAIDDLSSKIKKVVVSFKFEGFALEQITKRQRLGGNH